MNIRDIHLLYEYNYWANQKLLTAGANISQEQFIKPTSFPYGDLHGTLLHILEAEWGWRALFQKIDDASDLLPADYPDLSTIETRWNAEETAMRAYLATLRDEDMESHLHYTTDTGIARNRILWHCLLHARHSTP